MARMALYKRLVGRCIAVEKARTKADRFKALLDLKEFFDKHKPHLVYLSVGVELTNLEETLTSEERAEMSRAGYVFPEEWDRPRDYFKKNK